MKLRLPLFKLLAAYWAELWRPGLGHLPVPTEEQITEHLRVGAFRVEEDWRRPMVWRITLPTLYTVIHVGPGSRVERKTRGHEGVPLSPVLRATVSAILLTEEAPSAE